MNALNDIFFSGPNEGWAVGEKGTVLNTADGGQSWVRQSKDLLLNFPPRMSLHGITSPVILSHAARVASNHSSPGDGSATFLLRTPPFEIGLTTRCRSSRW